VSIKDGVKNPATRNLAIAAYGRMQHRGEQLPKNDLPPKKYLILNVRI